jgi:threonine dehydrogenase-like Zn-dependent dehydrogenase
MLALVLDPSPRLVADHPEPARGPGEAVVAVRMAGVCDTDLQLARGYMSFRGVPGHEFVGDVVSADDASWIGRRVVADINAGCGACEACARGDAHHCPTRTVLGILGRSGAFAERLTIPERCLVAVPDDVDDERAVFAEPLAAALHVLDEAAAASAERAVVLGDGKLGQLIARALAGSGLRTAMLGHHDEKLRIARDAGVETWLDADAPARIAGADLVVEATGSEAGLARAMSLVRPRGTIVLKTTIASPLTVDLSPVVIHEVHVVGSRCGDLRRAIGALAEGGVDPRPLVAAKYPLARADEALAHAGRRGTLKVLLRVAG